jgi:hypothetical protein
MNNENETAAPEVLPPMATPPQMLAQWLRRRVEWEDQLAHTVRNNPMEALAALLIGSAVLFHAVESRVNPKVRTFWDALYFISTCASVGYSDIFARTETGKAIASLVMTMGPALCAEVFDRPEPQPAPTQQPELQAVIERLDAILAELRQLRQ